MEYEVKASPNEVYKYLTDIEKVAECLPSLSGLEVKKDEFSARFKIDVSKASDKLHIGYLSQTTAKMRFRFEDMIENERASVVGEGRAVGSKVSVRINFRLKPEDSGTHIYWDADAELSIILRVFGERLTNEISHDIVSKVIVCLKEKIV